MEQFLQQVVGLAGDVVHDVQLLIGRETQRDGMVPVDERILQLVVVVAQVHDRIRVAETVLDAQAYRQGAGNPVVHHHLQGNDLDLPAQLLVRSDGLHIVGFHAVFIEIIQQQGGNPVVQHALSLEAGPLDVVVGDRDIRVAEDHQMGIAGRKDLLFVPLEHTLSFIDHFLK